MSLITSNTNSPQTSIATPNLPQNEGLFSKSYSWLTANCSVNKVAGTLVAGSIMAGTIHAYMNPDPMTGKSHDVTGGAALALGSSMLISGITATLQYLRGQTRDATLWALGTVCAGLPLQFMVNQNSPEYQGAVHAARLERDIKTWEECHQENAEVVGTRINGIDCALLESAKPIIDDNSYRLCTKALAGHAYFPDNIPVAIKQIRGKGRLIEQMEQAQQLLKINDYKHLQIAESTYYKDYAIQSLLPIPPYNEVLQVGLYLEHREMFTDVIREFTGFMCQAELGDLDTSNGGGSQSLSLGFSTPRFDNLMMFLEAGREGTKGKIALPDLDYFKSVDKGTDLSHQVTTVVRFFPYHLDEIMQEAKKFYPHIESQRKYLETIRDNSCYYYSKLYSDRLAHIQSKGISLSNPDMLAEIPIQVKQHILDDVADKIWKAHTVACDSDKQFGSCGYEQIYLRQFLNGQPLKLVSSNENVGKPEYIFERQKYDDFSYQYSDEVYHQFKLKLPLVMDSVLDFVGEMLKNKRSDGKVSLQSIEELVAFRTLRYRTDSTEFKTITERVAGIADIDRGAADLVIKIFFETMTEHGQLAYYTRSHPSGPLFQSLAC